MSFTAKIKATGEFFQATTDLGAAKDVYRDAHLPILPDTYYLGHLFTGTQIEPIQDLGLTKIQYKTVTSGTFRGIELEYLPEEIRLLPVH